MTDVGKVTGAVGSTLAIVDCSIGVELPGRRVLDGSAMGIVRESVDDARVVVAGGSVGKIAASEGVDWPSPDDIPVTEGCPPLFPGNESVMLASSAGVVSYEGTLNGEDVGSCPSVVAGVLES